jgi:hypothetical protein
MSGACGAPQAAKDGRNVKGRVKGNHWGGANGDQFFAFRVGAVLRFGPPGAESRTERANLQEPLPAKAGRFDYD